MVKLVHIRDLLLLLLLLRRLQTLGVVAAERVQRAVERPAGGWLSLATLELTPSATGC